jgi:hypothetical protein
LEISVFGCDKPTDTSSDDEEIRSSGEDLAELVDELDDEWPSLHKFINFFFLFLFFIRGLV